MKKIFIDEELRTLQNKFTDDKESENIMKKVETKFELPNIKPNKFIEKNAEKIVAEKNSEKIVSEKVAEVQKPSVGIDLFKIYQGIKDNNNKDRLL